MDKNEFMLRVAEMVLRDWRAVLGSESSNLVGDTVHISYRAMQVAKELADEFYKEESKRP